MDINKKKVLKNLIHIIERLFNISFEYSYEKMLDEELLGLKMGLAARDLVYLFFEVEKSFSITIPEERICDGKFNNLNNIADIIYEQLAISNITKS